MKSNEKNKILLVDGNYLMFQSFYGTYSPNGYIMSSTKGVPTNGTHMFFMILFNLINSLNPTHIFIAFDAPGKTKRHDIYPEYKDGRSKAPEEIFIQFNHVKQILSELNIQHNELVGYEADDLVGTLSKNLSGRKMIYSRDKDLLQLVSKDTTVIFKDNKIKDYAIITDDNFKEIYEIQPFQIPDFKGLAGDSSDNLHGIRGIGEKTAIKLINKYGSLENILQNLNNLSPSISLKIKNDIESGIMCKKLAIINTQVQEISKNDDDYKFKLDKSGTKTLKELELNQILNIIEMS
ncbi:5'-3' exonuclease [Mycoplasmopsis anatis]|uniref:5'-3' exonuclease n=1 Tax=Mycoplasmopsis anatis TaxID=171279 RepID=A0A9Q3QFB4_9BACT|nr:5'-3' exonuclease [Mycoplasmopsis anatis]MBW0594526.1 5'-3' exonuclease [Mycoplasmopsis anatis]MBW0595301.1 5'-3' exonuclease [Mycoplasmopsis anatis]MBW0596125.1 5'-3' exonuclease [Mycoplasmopsis anatis]MBW0596809.1 5'-3' exonuclease [Mycoplasmopsis anatis]MBW0597760.1 5'-3' exonuclease [Mycoplasmopsis anatis]